MSSSISKIVMLGIVACARREEMLPGGVGGGGGGGFWGGGGEGEKKGTRRPAGWGGRGRSSLAHHSSD